MLSIDSITAVNARTLYSGLDWTDACARYRSSHAASSYAGTIAVRMQRLSIMLWRLLDT